MLGTTYQSPSSNRYGTAEMRFLWSERYKRETWRKVWVALASAQCPTLISGEELDAICLHRNDIDLGKTDEIEEETQHDVYAELSFFAWQCGDAGCKLHLGATSSDIVENARVLVIKEAIDLIDRRLETLLKTLGKKRREWQGVKSVGRTHLQIADPVDMSERVRNWAWPLKLARHELARSKKLLRGKGFKGSVGNYHGYIWAYKLQHNLPDEEARRWASVMEKDAMALLCLPVHKTATQIGDKSQEYWLASILASVAMALHKMHQDLRLLAGFGELGIEKPEAAVGSSAMPHKVNPIASENVCSLARLVPGLVGVLWENAANNWLERSLDDSANVRYVWPELFLILDHMLDRSSVILDQARPSALQCTKTLKENLRDVNRSIVLVQLKLRGVNQQYAMDALKGDPDKIAARLWKHIEPDELDHLLNQWPGRGSECPPE